jgi:hypothetical protein
MDYVYEVPLSPNHIETLAAKDVFPYSINWLSSSFRSYKDINFFEIRDAPNEFFENNFTDKASTASYENSFVFKKFSYHDVLFVYNLIKNFI